MLPVSGKSMIQNLLLELLEDLFVGLTPECEKHISYVIQRASFLLGLRQAGRDLVLKGCAVAALFLTFSLHCHEELLS